jgi:hypothetical protein
MMRSMPDQRRSIGMKERENTDGHSYVVERSRNYLNDSWIFLADMINNRFIKSICQDRVT